MPDVRSWVITVSYRAELLRPSTAICITNSIHFGPSPRTIFGRRRTFSNAVEILFSALRQWISNCRMLTGSMLEKVSGQRENYQSSSFLLAGGYWGGFRGDGRLTVAGTDAAGWFTVAATDLGGLVSVASTGVIG